MKVVILAGGLGTRISEESHLKPKPMITIGEHPILWHIMKYYTAFGFKDFVICCGYKSNVIKEYFANYYLYNSTVTFDFTNGNEMIVHQNIAEPWRVTLVETGLYTQTGARIKRAQPYIGDEPFMMTYGDGLCDVNLNELLSEHKTSGKTVTITGVRPVGRFGVMDLEKDSNTIIGFREKSKKDMGWINGGFMVMNPQIFDYLSAEKNCVLETKPFEELADKRELNVYKHYGFWQCMDTQRDRYKLEELWEKDAPWKVWK